MISLNVESKIWHKWIYLQNRNRLNSDSKDKGEVATNDIGAITLNSNRICTVRVTHKLKNNTNKEVSCTVAKALGPMSDFLTWGSSKGTGNNQRIQLWRSVNLITEHPQGLGKQILLGGTNKTLRAPGTTGKEQWPHKRLNQTCLQVSEGLLQRYGLVVTCWRDTGTGNSSTRRPMLA